MPLLRVNLLGEFSLFHAEQRVTSVKTPRLQSLLAYLLLHRGSQLSRLHVASLYWPDSNEAQARTNLRQLLHFLRRSLPDAERFLQVETNSIMWKSDNSLLLDVALFEDLLLQAGDTEASTAKLTKLIQAVDLYKGELLPGCFDEWILSLRDRYSESYIGALQQLTRLLEEKANYEAAIQYTRRLLQADPLEEKAYRRLMRLYVRTGDRNRALRTYHAGVEMLKQDLGVEPEPETRRFYESLLRVDESLHEPSAKPSVSLVGRERAWHQLQMAWRTALARQSHFVLVSGVAGIGKTRMIEELLSWANQQGIVSASARGYAAEDRPAFGPIVEWLRSDLYLRVLRELDDHVRSQLSHLIPELETKKGPTDSVELRSESWHRQRFSEVVANTVLSAGNPLILTLDDLQWVDGETLSLLRYLLHARHRTSFLLVCAVRSEDLEFDDSLASLLLNLRASGHMTELELGRLNKEQTTQLAEQVAARHLSESSAAAVFKESEGYPLFVIEMVRAGLTTGLKARSRGAGVQGSREAQGEASKLLPARVAAIIETRLRQLSPEARELAELASVIGREFELELLVRAGKYTEEIVVEKLHELWRRRIVREQGQAGYDFSHVKIREVTYAHLEPPHRKLLHRSVAETLEELYAEDLEAVSGQIAEHFEHAGMHKQAIVYYRRAADGALRIYAHTRVIRTLTSVLSLLEKLPRKAEHLREELQTQIALGSAHTVVSGYAAPEVALSFSRARELCRLVGNSQEELIAALWGLHSYHQVRAEFERSREYTEHFMDQARRIGSPALMQLAYLNLGTIQLQRGEFVYALDSLEQSVGELMLEKGDPREICFGPDPRLFSRCFLAHTLWHLGYTDRAFETLQESRLLADEIGGPFEAVVVLLYSSMLHQFRNEPEPSEIVAEEALALCDKYGYAYYKGWANILIGWSQSQVAGQKEQGITRMQQALSDLKATGGQIREPYYLGLLAEAKAALGYLDDSLHLLAEGLTLVEHRGERWCESSLHRIKGDVLSKAEPTGKVAEESYVRSLEVARSQQARSLELQAAIRLAHWWAEQGREEQAYQLLTKTAQDFQSDDTWPDLRCGLELLRKLGRRR